MDQERPRSDSGFGTTGSGSGYGTTSGSDFGTGAGGGGGTGSMGGSGTGGGGLGAASLGGDTSTGADVCPTCGQSKNRGLEQFLGRIGITEEMISNLKSQWQNVDVDEYLTTARDYLKDGGTKAQTYAKDNPGKVAAGVAALALGAGLIYAATHRDK
jgi:hypothetical protein